MKRWCIINLDYIRNAEFADRIPLDCEYLPGDNRPSVFYSDLGAAEMALLRLATKSEGKGEFYLFEAVAMVVESMAVKGAKYIEEVRGD